MPKRKNTEQFIQELLTLYGDKYDYSKINYVNSSTKVCLICHQKDKYGDEHGEFWVMPNDLLNGHQCPSCGGCKRLNTESFIKKSNKIHNNKYDYSSSVYKNNKTKISIICPIHGEFKQIPNNHLLGHGCPKCKNNDLKLKYKTEGQEQFIDKARKVHGDKYDYSKVEYVNNRTKISIICPMHGEFLQTPNAHLNGHGCQKCKIEKLREINLKNKDIFVTNAINIHGNKYDYSKVEYVNNSTKVCIICPIHGEFWQTPNNHLYGYGCDKCAREKNSLVLRKTLEDFINESNTIHNFKYDYSKVEYINIQTPVCIICPEHGEFWQKPSVHLYGHGCPKCNQSRLENEISIFLEKNNIKYFTQYKFDWLRFNGLMKLDFYLPEYNIAIECQGEQHFKSIDFFGGEENFKYTYERDKQKFELCKENNIKLLYYSNLGIEYPYRVYEDLEELLKEIKQ